MTKIDVRDLISLLTSSPVKGLHDVGAMILTNLAHRWWQLLIIVLVFSIGRSYALARKSALSTPIRSENRKSERSRAKRSLMFSVFLFFWWSLFILMALGQLGITMSSSTSSWVIGAASFAAVFAGQNVVKDVIAGYHVIVEDHYGVGDYIDTGFGFAGVVTSIGVRTTALKSADGTMYYIRHSEISKVGNKTQASGSLILDVTCQPYEERRVTSDDVSEYESLLVEATAELRRTLRGVAEVASNKTPTTVTIRDVADLVPTIVPNMTTDTLTDMQAITEQPQDSGLELVRSTLNRAPVGTTPVFRDIEMLGLSNADHDSVTLRLRVRLLERSSHTYAMSLLKRRVFDAFSDREVTVAFDEVDDALILN